MLERLGHVLGWIGNLLAVLVLLAAAALVYSGKIGHMDVLPFWIAAAVCALVIFLIGRALRYIFSGPARKEPSDVPTASDFWKR